MHRRRSKSQRRSSRKTKRYGGESIQRNTQTFSVYLNNKEVNVGIKVSQNSLQALYNIGQTVYGLKFNGEFDVSSEKVYYKLPSTFSFQDKKVVYTCTGLKDNTINIDNLEPVKEKDILYQLNAFETSGDLRGAVTDSIIGECTIS